MKKLFTLFLMMLLPLIASAQIERTINVATAGTLSSYISDDEKYQIEKLTLTGEINGDDITLTTDKKVLAQVVMNLLSNCDRYGKEGSAVDIAVSRDALTITNKTDKTYDDVDLLKKPFVKGEDSRGNRGAGVGLAIADNNLAMLGYKLELSSESDEFRARIKFKP